MIRIVLCITLAIVVVGVIGGDDVTTCVKANNTESTCLSTMNP